MGYPKFKEGKDCAYPERIICNYCDCGNLDRCEYMKFVSLGNWKCIFERKTDTQKNELKGKIKQQDG